MIDFQRHLRGAFLCEADSIAPSVPELLIEVKIGCMRPIAFALHIRSSLVSVVVGSAVPCSAYIATCVETCVETYVETCVVETCTER